MSWIPTGAEPPSSAELPTGHHLRPIREADTPIDYPAVMGSRERLWAKYGEAWGWPPETMTFEQDARDLARHERENLAHEAFNYAILDERETALLGCVYIDPPREGSDAQAVVSWWVVDEEAGGPLDAALSEFVPAWLRDTWKMTHVDYSP